MRVTFESDSNGILNVAATDKASGKSQKITITASTNLTKDEVEKMVRDADSHAAEDKRRREEIELRNQADSLVYTTEKALRDAGDKVPADLKARIEAGRDRVKKVLEASTLDRSELQSAMEQLAQAAQGIGEHLYGQAGGTGPATEGAGTQPQQGPVEGEVVDAEYEVK